MNIHSLYYIYTIINILLNYMYITSILLILSLLQKSFCFLIIYIVYNIICIISNIIYIICNIYCIINCIIICSIISIIVCRIICIIIYSIICMLSALEPCASFYFTVLVDVLEIIPLFVNMNNPLFQLQ